MLISVIASFLILAYAPDLLDQLSSLLQVSLDYGDTPEPYTLDFFTFIFLNNSSHFWNPVRMIVWIPLVGPLLLGLEVLLNSGLIGVVAVIVGTNNGIAYTILGLVPHGIIEIPAFILQLSAIILWQVTITEAILDKLKSRPLNKTKIKLDLWSAAILAATSIVLLLVAAAIETYVTPYFIGL